jgi:tetratricopeptide (TPR) repeat protein
MMKLQTPAAAPRSHRVGTLVAGLALVVAVAACGGKTEMQLANDALNAGLAASAAGNTEEAKRQYNECLKHDVTNVACHYDLGVIAQLAGDPTTAENQYRLALSTDPNYTPALFNLAILRTGLGDTAEALGLYRKYVTLLPDKADGHLNLGLLLIATGDKSNGDKEIAAAIKIDPTISIPQSSPSPAAPSERPSASPGAPSPSA